MRGSSGGNLVKSVRSKLDVMTMDDVVFLKEADGKKSIPSFRAAQSCALNRLVKADSKVEYNFLKGAP